MITTHIIPELGEIYLNKLQAIHLQKFYNNKLQNGRLDKSGGLSPRTVRYLHSIIREALSHAVKWQLINKNVAELIDPPTDKRSKKINTLNAEEVKRLLSHAKEDRLYLAFLLAISTGLRRGEILGLSWQDIDFESKTAV